MIDVVINDMAYAGPADATNFSTFTPFNKAEYFHPYCPVDYSNDTSAEKCWLGDNTVALADLDTESTFVMETFQTWIAEMVANYSRASFPFSSFPRSPSPPLFPTKS